MKRRINNFEHWNLLENFRESFTKEAFMTSTEATSVLAEALINHPDFTYQEKLCFIVLKESNTSITEWEVLDEGLIDKLKDAASKIVDKGKEYYQDIKTTIGDEIKGIPDFFNALKDGIKRIAGYIKEFLTKVVKYIFGSPETYMKDTVGDAGMKSAEEKLKEEAKKNKNQIKQEVSGIKDMVVGTPKLFSPKTIGEDVEKALTKSDSENVEDKELSVVKENFTSGLILAFAESVKVHTKEEILEGLNYFNTLNEEDPSHEGKHFKIPFVSTLTHFIEKFPPFNWLKKFVDYASEHANQSLTALSKMFKEKGAVPESVEFIVMGTIVALFIEDILKKQTKHAIIHLVPPVGWAVSALGLIASGIWMVHLTATIVSGLEKVEDEMEAAVDKIESA